jgi:hypothetical protein
MTRSLTLLGGGIAALALLGCVAFFGWYVYLDIRGRWRRRRRRGR